MDDFLKETESSLSVETLSLAAKNLQHYLKIQNETVTLDAIVHDLRNTLDHRHAPENLSDILTLQAKILDAAFAYYMNKARDSYVSDDMVQMAFKAQRQTISTVNALRHLNKKP